MNPITLITLSLALLLVPRNAIRAAQLHVAISGKDTNPGSKASPLRTIQRAAELAQPGDVITVHEGVYRERINPARGGASDQRRIVYQAAEGERVEVKGSEIIKNWVKVENNVWKVTLPNSLFGSFNPYSDLIHGDWFDPKGRLHHTGAVYLNGEWLAEAAKLDDVLAGAGAEPFWFGQVDDSNTTIWARFNGVNPNDEQVEINVRQTVFYPAEPGRNYITVRGFVMRHAATPWAPPTAKQIGLIGTHWSKGWVIENNIISHSTCSGIALGKYGDQYDNTSANTAEGYVKTVERALRHGWNSEHIGHHVVCNNTISHCEQAGIVGSLGAAFSTVTGNTIHDIHVRRLFSGAEMAGIKFHGAVDTVIRGNHIYRTCLGLWLDWMAQGTRVSANLFHDNGRDLFVEVNHGPFAVDNNLFLSAESLLDMSEGGAYAHNLFNGKLISVPEPNRQTPYHAAHSTAVAGLGEVKGGDCRFYNNLFVGRKGDSAGWGLGTYDARSYPLQTGGNVYYNRTRPYVHETGHAICDTDLKAKLLQENGVVVLQFSASPSVSPTQTKLVTTALLGKAKISGCRFERADGLPLSIDLDYFGTKRNTAHPTSGPFESCGKGPMILNMSVDLRGDLS